MPSLAEAIRRQLEESARVKQSFPDELIARIAQFAEKSAAALRAGGKKSAARAKSVVLVFLSGGMSHTDDLMLFGIHSTKYDEFLFCTLSICSSTSFVDIRPRNSADAGLNTASRCSKGTEWRVHPNWSPAVPLIGHRFWRTCFW